MKRILRFPRLLVLVPLLVVATACDSTEPVVGSIEGTVTIDGEAARSVTVRLIADTVRTAFTSAAGGFQFSQVAGGTYTVELGSYPDDASFTVTSRSVSVSEPGQIATTGFEGIWIRTSSISGTVVASGQPVAGIIVELSGPTENQKLTDAAGAYEFNFIRAGTYTLTLSGFDPEQYAFGSTQITQTTGVDQSVSAPFAGQVLPPLDPAALSAAELGPDRIDLSWEDVSAYETRYVVERRLDGGEYEELPPLDANTTSFSDVGLLSGTLYSYRLRACNDSGCSQYSNEAFTETDEVPPVSPINLTANPAGPARIELIWADPAHNTTAFSIERTLTTSGGLGFNEIVSLDAGVTTYDDDVVQVGLSYDYRILACNEAGCSPPSNVATAVANAMPDENLLITAVYLTQAAQNVAGSVPLLQGVEALLRVFVLSDAVTFAQPAVRVRLYQNGTLAQTYTIQTPAPGFSVPTFLDESSMEKSWTVTVPGSLVQPGLSVLVDVDPDGSVPESNETDNLFPTSGVPAGIEVRDPSPFNVVLVPVRQSAAGGLEGDVSVPDDFVTMARKVFPIHTFNVTVREFYGTGAPILQSDDGNGAWGTVLGEILALRTADGSTAHYYGVVKTNYSAGVAGLGYIGAPAAIGWDRAGSRSGVAAHEWGHNFQRRHAPCGGAGNPDPSYPYAGGSTGVFGWDRESGSLKEPTTFSDLMGYCSPEWISDYTYQGIMTYRQANPAPPAGGAGPDQEGLLIWGRIDGEGNAVLEPAFQIRGRPALPTRAGPYRVRGLDDRGAELFSLSFEGLELSEEAGGGRHFAFLLPVGSFDEARLASLRLEGPGVLANRAPTAVQGGGSGSGARVRPTADGAEVSWDQERYPVVILRHPDTGRILSFARGGTARLGEGLTSVDITLSDGVRSSRRTVGLGEGR